MTSTVFSVLLSGGISGVLRRWSREAHEGVVAIFKDNLQLRSCRTGDFDTGRIPVSEVLGLLLGNTATTGGGGGRVELGTH